MKITYNNIKGLFRASCNRRKIPELSNNNLLIRQYEAPQQEGAYQKSDLSCAYTHRYNMRDNVTISMTNERIV